MAFSDLLTPSAPADTNFTADLARTISPPPQVLGFGNAAGVRGVGGFQSPHQNMALCRMLPVTWQSAYERATAWQLEKLHGTKLGDLNINYAYHHRGRLSADRPTPTNRVSFQTTGGHSTDGS
ncbi:MAG: hypothetical protein PHE53_08315 [Thermoguttaceae bacterium]|nr:hypothetical protein [Thermoguttaceae bacterium]